MRRYIFTMVYNLIISLLHFGLFCQTKTRAAANVIRPDCAEKLQLLVCLLSSNDILMWPMHIWYQVQCLKMILQATA